MMQAGEAMIREDVKTAQATFRALLKAMAEPGIIVDIPYHGGGGVDAGATPYMPILRTLLDHEVSFCAMTEGVLNPSLAGEVSRSTGAVTAGVEEADFILFIGGDSRGMASKAKRGSPEYPEEGATLIYLVDELRADRAPENRWGRAEGPQALRLSGPGVKGERSLYVLGLKKEEVEAISQARRSFPMGTEVILCDRNGRLSCLPRSTRLGTEG